jgi:hypothetical protein
LYNSRLYEPLGNGDHQGVEIVEGATIDAWFLSKLRGVFRPV